MPNATCIYLYEGQRAPIVFDTALTERERQSLAGWLAENPDVASLIEQANALSVREEERLDISSLDVFAERAFLQIDALAELRNMLPRVVAAREELAIGALDESETILSDLETDLAGLLGGLA